MKSPHFVFAMFCSFSVACSGGSGSGSDGGRGSDGGGGSDGGSREASDARVSSCESVASGSAASCNAATGAGCAAGEKCAQIVESASPFLARMDCVPEGDVPVGGACTQCGGGVLGYDDCVAGSHCSRGSCSEICGVGTDSCRNGSSAPFDGSYCTRFESLFDDTLGLCVPACHPVEDATSGGVVTNNHCAADEGCYLNSTRGTATCALVPELAGDLTQNADCYGPGGGGCYLNGCASGFIALLGNAPVNAESTTCARLCTPVVTHSNAQAGAAGADGKCSEVSLQAVGGTGGIAAEHQCRFVQNFYSYADRVPEDVGMCVPILAAGGASWADCNAFDWDGMKAAWNGAIGAGEDPNEAFSQFCLEDPSDETSGLKPACAGLFHGCISLAEEDALLAP